MPRVNVSSGSPLEGPIGFSRAVRVGNLIAVSGTAPIGPDGLTVAVGDVYLQTKRCLEISVTAIASAGGRIDDVIRTRIMLTDIATWEAAAKAHGEFFGGVKPACTFVQVSAFIRSDWLVETEMDCVCESA